MLAWKEAVVKMSKFSLGATRVTAAKAPAEKKLIIQECSSCFFFYLRLWVLMKYMLFLFRYLFSDSHISNRKKTYHMQAYRPDMRDRKWYLGFYSPIACQNKLFCGCAVCIDLLCDSISVPWMIRSTGQCPGAELGRCRFYVHIHISLHNYLQCVCFSFDMSF